MSARTATCGFGASTAVSPGSSLTEKLRFLNSRWRPCGLCERIFSSFVTCEPSMCDTSSRSTPTSVQPTSTRPKRGDASRTILRTVDSGAKISPSGPWGALMGTRSMTVPPVH